ncbi:hypothetical protein AUEXF2481DRAFT_47927 [Aureobasidium subglaciale EXF-2481]|uniref:ABC transporter domain-containing protein n=1 Tax=Aureobasidium subglaciale (strain EXF-2481) TaxID=1043005 RepID=A0A074Y8F9_AURSE|nr:uncharacterized protein AUEXF2481DRAFT_47927 [Aureobasidium subglaciale EXF-2481]KEQ92274.1 hypothetical protein AUEXF2481DRAFT_47927 [Aureobasidium subglaciale EXF-2481]
MSIIMYSHYVNSLMDAETYPRLPRGLYISSVLASLYLIVAVYFRWRELQKASIKIGSNRHGDAKVLLNSALIVAQSCIVGISASGPLKLNLAVSEAIHLVAIIALSILSPREHDRSVGPSTLLVVYLSVRTTTSIFILPFMRGKLPLIVVALKAFLEAADLVVESRSKRGFLLAEYQDIAPEDASGPWSKVSFAWINPLLFVQQTLTFSLWSLPQAPRRLDPALLRQKILEAWDQRAKPEGQLTLPLTLLQCLLPDFVTIAPTRLLLIVFRYAQPLLISKILQLLAANALAIVSSRYQHQLNRLKVMTRAALVGLIYDKTINLPSAAYKDYSAVTLMSTDTDALGNVSGLFHEAWAQVLEVIVGMILLAQHIGWFCLVSLPLIYSCSHMTRYVAPNLRPRQHAWNQATQDRINNIVTTIGRIKLIKMIGLAEFIETRISDLRRSEIDASKDMRWVSVLANTSANALGLFTPPITIVLFAALSKSRLDAETAYTTLAILVMVTHPANMIMTIVPRAIASLASFQRIQSFIAKPGHHDTRLLLGRSETAIEFDNVDLKLTDATEAILEDVNLRISKGSIVICTGPTGVGKSLLGLTIAGEVRPSGGSISVISKQTALCAQSPWLSGQSVPEIIRGTPRTSEVYDDAWYQRVVDACCIDEAMHHNLAPKRGRNGSASLSGGQKQRISLARAVYQRCEILILDDPFSALDQRTQDSVINNLIGPAGLLRESHTTVFLTTNATRAYFLADRILLLGQRQIEFDGDSDGLRSHLSMTRLALHEYGKTEIHNEKTQSSLVTEQKLATIDNELDVDRRPGDMSVYGYYLRSVGISNMLALLVCTALYSFFSIFPQYWLKWWTEAGTTNDTFYTFGYLALSTIAWISTSAQMWVNFMKLAPRSGKVLHASLLSTVLEAPLSWFLNNDTGAIVNRFSQDIEVIDRDLPSALAALCTQIFKLLMQCSLLLASQKLLIFALPIYSIAVYVIQRVYLRTSRQLRYLELESRSAVYSSFLETVEGLTTIRAFGWQKDHLARNTESLDLSQRAFYLFLCLQRWLNVVLDLAVAVVAIVVIGLAVFYTGEKSSADVGIALNIVLVANTTLLRLVESWTTLEVSVGAAARLKELEDTVPKEDNLAVDIVVPSNWPSAGALTLKNVRVCYGPHTVLNNINLAIPSGEKVFICGKTGSGKSTLLMALLKLCIIQTGSIFIDDKEITNASPSLLRSRCFIAVPQESFHLPSVSLRKDLDPYARHSDAELLNVLELLHLTSHFTLYPDTSTSTLTSPLDLPLSFFPPLSSGKSQLLSLARAVLQVNNAIRNGRKPIILLDEAAASLDAELQELCARVVEEQFSQRGFTVLMITHSVKDLGERVRKGRDMVLRVDGGGVEVIG